jgi:hypothetical protein
MEKLDKFIRILEKTGFDNLEKNFPIDKNGKIQMRLGMDIHLDTENGPIELETKEQQFLRFSKHQKIFKNIDISIDIDSKKESFFNLDRYITFTFLDEIVDMDDETFELFLALNI